MHIILKNFKRKRDLDISVIIKKDITKYLSLTFKSIKQSNIDRKNLKSKGEIHSFVKFSNNKKVSRTYTSVSKISSL